MLLVDDGDGEPKARTLGLTAQGVKVAGLSPLRPWRAQLAIVTDAGGVRYLVSDIIEARAGGRMEAPAFHAPWRQVAPEATPGSHPPASAGSGPVHAAPGNYGFWYVGYGRSFHNYRAGPGLDIASLPAAPRLRIGLRHGASAARRDAVGFAAYMLRITDDNGDAVQPPVRTRRSDYGMLAWTKGSGQDAVTDSYAPLIFLYDTGTGADSKSIYNAADNRFDAASVRVVDAEGRVTAGLSLNTGGVDALPDGAFGAGISNWGAGVLRLVDGVNTLHHKAPVGVDYFPVVYQGTVFAPLPDHHRDFPVGTLKSDETYALEAWAVNDPGEPVGQRVRIRVRAQDTRLTSGTFKDHLNTGDLSPAPDGPLIVTAFTVILPE